MLLPIRSSGNEMKERHAEHQPLTSFLFHKGVLFWQYNTILSRSFNPETGRMVVNPANCKLSGGIFAGTKQLCECQYPARKKEWYPIAEGCFPRKYWCNESTVKPRRSTQWFYRWSFVGVSMVLRPDVYLLVFAESIPFHYSDGQSLAWFSRDWSQSTYRQL